MIARICTSLGMLLALGGACHADAVLFSAPYERPVGVSANLSGTVLVEGNEVTKARLKWHGPNYQMVATSGTWDDENISVSGLGCNYDPYPAKCFPDVPMTYSNINGLAIDGEPTNWTLVSYWALQVPMGDSNRDSVFDSSDLVSVFQRGQYEDNYKPDGDFNEPGYINSNWNSGDWNLDQEFDSADLVFAFQEGSYESAAISVPEPQLTWWMIMLGLLAVRGGSYRRAEKEQQ